LKITFPVLLFSINLTILSCSFVKNKSEVNDRSVVPKKSLGEPVSIDLSEKSNLENQKLTYVENSLNCFSKEVFDANQRDCSNEIQDWVCGCNSVSYPNVCEAKKAGVKTFKKGKCLKEAKDI
jgi:hypothetical protein